MVQDARLPQTRIFSEVNRRGSRPYKDTQEAQDRQNAKRQKGFTFPSTLCVEQEGSNRVFSYVKSLDLRGSSNLFLARWNFRRRRRLLAMRPFSKPPEANESNTIARAIPSSADRRPRSEYHKRLDSLDTHASSGLGDIEADDDFALIYGIAVRCFASVSLIVRLCNWGWRYNVNKRNQKDDIAELRKQGRPIWATRTNFEKLEFGRSGHGTKLGKNRDFMIWEDTKPLPLHLLLYSPAILMACGWAVYRSTEFLA